MSDRATPTHDPLSSLVARTRRPRARARSRWRWPSVSTARLSPATRSRSTWGWTSAPPSRPARSAAASRTTASISATPTSRFTPRAGRRWRARPQEHRAGAAGCPSSSAAPASTTARSPPACSRRPRPIRRSARATARSTRARGTSRCGRGSGRSIPRRPPRIAPRDFVRTSRALEVYEQTGIAITTLRRQAAPPRDLRPTTLVLDPPLAELRARIEARVEAMLAAGFLDEVRALRAAGYGAGLKPMQALGYKQLGAVLDGNDDAGRRDRRDRARHRRLRAPPADLVQEGGRQPRASPSRPVGRGGAGGHRRRERHRPRPRDEETGG